MDNVVTSIMVFEGDGKVNEYVGGYSDWVSHGGKLVGFEEAGTDKSAKEKGASITKSETKTSLESSVKSKKLSFKDQRELEQLPALIEQLENEQEKYEQKISDPAFYDNDSAKVTETLAQLTEIQGKLEQAYARWEELE